ncbi:MAG: ABC transporter permease [Armatimonadetes bacterium]|nr:ABC transporter permease [Armatimonadota bacterium]MDW8121257.1 ABC transporter permease [Armatimonadota bacterium]
MILRRLRNWAVTLLPILVGLLLGLFLVAIAGSASGFSPSSVLQSLWEGAFGDQFAIAETLVRSIPVLMTGLGVAVCFRAGLWNIGAEGQLIIGGLSATALLLQIPMPTGLALLSGSLAGAVGGSLWALPAALLKLRSGINEVIVTLLLNFVAAGLLGFLVTGPLMEQEGSLPQTDPLPETARWTLLLLPTRLHLGLFFALLLALVLHFVMEKTVIGLDWKAYGASPESAKTLGIREDRVIWSAFLVGGALAGIGGAMEVMGATYRLYEKWSPGYGYSGIVAALVARLNAAALIPSSLLLGALTAGGLGIQRTLGLPPTLTWVIQACLLLPITLRLRPKG